jgi:hypothetical protein
MRAALDVLRRRSNNPGGAECLPRLDRLQGVCDQDPTQPLIGVAGLWSGQKRQIRAQTKGSFQPYGCAQWFHGARNGLKVAIESDRRERFLSPYRLTLFADDLTGLLPAEVFNVLEQVPDFQLTMIELALDFPEGLDRGKVRQHVLFGKTRPAPSVNGTDYWGTRKGLKLCRCYFKSPIQAFRVEFELRPRFLKYYGVRDVFGFQKLAGILPSRHISFGKLNEKKLIDRMNHMALSAKRRQRVLHTVALMSSDLWTSLNYLRDDVLLRNTRRLVDPLPINTTIADALRKWAAQWPTAPTRLGKKK